MPIHGVKPRRRRPLSLETIILAGGRSSRMGTDKARLTLDRRSLLVHVRAGATALGHPVRVIRRDLVRRCGPLGGILTALRTSRKDWLLILPCDMPFVSPALLRLLWKRRTPVTRAIFTVAYQRVGFPIYLRHTVLEVVERLVAKHEYSLQALARACRARRVRVSPRYRKDLWNINTPDDLRQARILDR